MRAPKFSGSESGCGVYDWPGAIKPPIVMCHATGFHGRVWDRIVAMLPEHRVIAPDLPGHGRGAKRKPPADWPSFGHAITKLGAELHLKGAIGVGHSMGGHSLVQAAGKLPGAFAGLVLLDPVIRPRESYGTLWHVGHYAAKRRNEWASAEEMLARFESRPPFDRWDHAVLKDYCDYALDGNVLACSPAFEASVYENSTARAADPSDFVERLEIPVVIIRAPGILRDSTLDLSASPTDPKLATRFRNARDEVWSDTSHFIPMEQPVRVAALIQEFTSQIRRAPGGG